MRQTQRVGGHTLKRHVVLRAAGVAALALGLLAWPSLTGASVPPARRADIAVTTYAFCLQAPASGYVRWTQSAGATTAPLLRVAVQGLPAQKVIGIFLDEGTARSAYEIAHFTTSPAGSAAGSVPALFAPPRPAYRLLFESYRGTSYTTPVVDAVAFACNRAAHPVLIAAPNNGAATITVRVAGRGFRPGALIAMRAYWAAVPRLGMHPRYTWYRWLQTVRATPGGTLAGTFTIPAMPALYASYTLRVAATPARNSALLAAATCAHLANGATTCVPSVTA